MVDTSYKSNKANLSQIDRLNRLTEKLNNVFYFFMFRALWIRLKIQNLNF